MELVDREECRRSESLHCTVWYRSAVAVREQTAFNKTLLPGDTSKRTCSSVTCILSTNKHMHITTAPTPEARLVRTDVEYGIILD